MAAYTTYVHNTIMDERLILETFSPIGTMWELRLVIGVEKI